MTDDAKPKRKYRRRQKVEPLAVYAVVVTVKTGRKTETIYGESVRSENGCLVVTSMDGPPPLIERVRYIPLGSAEITVCRRVQYAPQPEHQYQLQNRIHAAEQFQQQTGPQIQPGPLEIARQREAMGPGPKIVRNAPTGIVERNPDGIPVVTAGFFDGGIS